MKKIVSITVCGIILGVVVVCLMRDKVPKELGEQREAALSWQKKPNEIVEPQRIQNKRKRVNQSHRVVLDIRVFDEASMPHTLKNVMGFGVHKGYTPRIKAVHVLGKALSHSEIQSLYVFLNRKKGEDSLPLSKLNALKNDVVNTLRSQNAPAVNLSHNLMAMYYDKEHDNVWRDYCIQHLGGYYKKSSKKEEVVNALWEAAEETKISIAGTALIALTNNIDDPLIEREQVAAKAFELATDPKCGELAKITALQICAKLGEEKVLMVARDIATSGGAVPLRMSAIAAVGTLGNVGDRPMLEKYAKSSDVRLRKSAQSALTRLGK